MNENKQYTDPASRPDSDIPDMTAPYWKKKIDAAPVKQGRPKSDNNKVHTGLRLDADVIMHFKGDNPKGWQTRVNAALREIAGLK